MVDWLIGVYGTAQPRLGQNNQCYYSRPSRKAHTILFCFKVEFGWLISEVIDKYLGSKGSSIRFSRGFKTASILARSKRFSFVRRYIVTATCSIKAIFPTFSTLSVNLKMSSFSGILWLVK